jgi:predicted transcriptional regulator
MRNKFEIVYARAKASREPVCKTRIMGLTNLNHSYVTEVLKELVEKRMLASTDGKYLMTPHGTDFLESLETVLSIWHGWPTAAVLDIESEKLQVLKKSISHVNKPRRNLR